MITNEVVQRVQSKYSKGVQSDDTRLSSRHIYNKLSSVRITLVSQKSKKKQKINQWSYQTLSCVELEKTPIHECPCVPPLDCDIYRTKNVIPKPIIGMDSHLIQSISSLDGSVTFNEISWTEAKYKSSNKYTSNKPDYFERNDRLYFIQKKGVEVVQITGLFEKPLEVYEFESLCSNCTNCNKCISPLDLEFPIDGDLIEPLIELASKELIEEFSRNNEDVSNNTNDRNIISNAKD